MAKQKTQKEIDLQKAYRVAVAVAIEMRMIAKAVRDAVVDAANAKYDVAVKAADEAYDKECARIAEESYLI